MVLVDVMISEVNEDAAAAEDSCCQHEEIMIALEREDKSKASGEEEEKRKANGKGCKRARRSQALAMLKLPNATMSPEKEENEERFPIKVQMY